MEKAKTLGELTEEMMKKDGFDTTGDFSDSESVPFDTPEGNGEVKVKENVVEDTLTPEPEQKVEESKIESAVVELEPEVKADEEVDVSESTEEKPGKGETLEDLKKLTPEKLAAKKKEYDKYNTQKAQENAERSKELQQMQEDLIAAEGRMSEMYAKINEGVSSKKEFDRNETEIEMLNRKLGTSFDDLTDENQLILARRQVASDEVKVKEIEQQKIDKEKYREEVVKRNIRQLQVDWGKLKEEKSIPDSVEEPILSILFARRKQTPNYTIKQAYDQYMGSIPYTRDKEAFLKFAKESKWAADLTAIVLENAKVKRSKAGNIPDIKVGTILEKENKLEQGFSSLDEATEAALIGLKDKKY